MDLNKIYNSKNDLNFINLRHEKLKSVTIN